MRSICKHRGQ